jgi:hypothetical protein
LVQSNSQTNTARVRSRRLILVIAAAGAAAAAPLWLPKTCGIQWALIGGEERALVALKNRVQVPANGDFDRRVSLDALLARGRDDTRWSDRHAAAIEGYVTGVRPGPVEFANCLSFTQRDIHVHLARAPHARGIDQVVVEVTPYWRRWAREQGLDWSLDALRRHVGKRVRVEGWLLFDIEHDEESENTRPGLVHNWRATAWELHPVTGIHVVE